MSGDGAIAIGSKSADDAAFHVEMLYAGEGDCLLVTVPTDAGEFLILVDTGNGPAALEAARARLRMLPVNEEDRKRHLNLFIVTHIDEDHLQHAVALLSTRACPKASRCACPSMTSGSTGTTKRAR